METVALVLLALASLSASLQTGMPVSSPSPTLESPSTVAQLQADTILGVTLRWTHRAMECKASLETVEPALLVQG